jgi:Niemann-Pick C1 protein
VRPPVAAGQERDAPTIYVYSVFHPFFEQYLSVGRDAAFILSCSVAVVVAAAATFTGSLTLGCILAACLSSLLIDMLGCMVLLGVQLNAVSLVNLAMGVGISLEFVVHLAQGFLVAQGCRRAALLTILLCIVRLLACAMLSPSCRTYLCSITQCKG